MGFYGSGGKIAHSPSERCAQEGIMVNRALSPTPKCTTDCLFFSEV